MLDKAPTSKDTAARRPDDNIVRLGLFERPLASGKVPEKFTLYSYLTFKNIVVGVGALTLLIFLGGTVSIRMAFLLVVLAAFLALILMEMSSRRKWERDLLGQLQRMGGDYDRLVREVARNRNDMTALRKKLSEAGTLVRSYSNKTSEEATVEQRMVRTIAEQLSKLSESNQENHTGPEVQTVLPAEDAAVAEEAALSEDATGRKLTEAQVLQLVNAAVQQDRIDLFLQPIVNLPQRKLRFYEIFSRIRINPEFYLPASRYIEVAVKQDLMPVIDNLLLLRGLQIIRNTEEGDYNRAFFFNITSLTLNDPKFMGDLVEFIAQNRSLAPRLIFEMGQKDLGTMAADTLPVLDGLSKLGCRFSMDRVKSLDIDFDQLEARHVRFIKVNADQLMEEMKDPDGLQRIKRLKDAFDRNGIDVIVEKIENDRQVLELLELDIDYGQGYLFGKPALYKKTKS